LGERGFKVTLRPWKGKDIVLDRPLSKNVYHIAKAFLKEDELLPWAQHHIKPLFILSYCKVNEDLFVNHNFTFGTEPF